MSTDRRITMIAKLENDMAELKAQITELKSQIAELNASKASSPAEKTKKVKKERDPDAPKRVPSVWEQFNSRVRTILTTGGQDAKHSVMQFCSFLKEKKSYDEWTDAEILDAFGGWERPARKVKFESASDTGSVSEASAEKKQGKKRGPMSEEAKAAMAAKRAANKAAKATKVD
jgi:hypothetical protein